MGMEGEGEEEEEDNFFVLLEIEIYFYKKSLIKNHSNVTNGTKLLNAKYSAKVQMNCDRANSIYLILKDTLACLSDSTVPSLSCFMTFKLLNADFLLRLFVLY